MDLVSVTKQLAVFGAKVGTWAFGAAIVIEKISVNTLGDGWAFPDLEKVALAAFIAGPTALALKLMGITVTPPEA